MTQVPTVSVIVITYEDAGRVGRALASVTAQTFGDLEIVVVDDGSTDRTANVVERARALDPRIRYHRRATNSGGCGAPRNDGLELARGRWVMFLDSDDELEPDAVRVLVEAATAEGSDIVAGRVDRVNARYMVRRPYRPEAYDVNGTFAGVADRPELLLDFICVNKLYSRELLALNDLSFPTDVHYEDQIFTTQAWLAARRVTLIPDVVYLYYVSNELGNQSITNRRHLVSNLRDRLEVNRRIDDLLRVHPDPRLLRVKQERFITHDLHLFARDLPDRDEDFRATFVELVADYVAEAGITTDVAAQRPDRVLLRMLEQRDVQGTLDAAFLATKGGRIVRRLVERDGRWWWDERAALTRDVALDLTEFMGERRTRLTHVIESMVVEGTVITLLGHTVEPFGSFAGPDLRGLRLAAVDGDDLQFTGAVVPMTRESLREPWTATLDLEQALETAPLLSQLQIEVRLLLEGGRYRDAPVARSQRPEGGLRIRAGRPWYGFGRRREAELQVSGSGRLSVRFDDWAARPLESVDARRGRGAD